MPKSFILFCHAVFMSGLSFSPAAVADPFQQRCLVSEDAYRHCVSITTGIIDAQKLFVLEAARNAKINLLDPVGRHQIEQQISGFCPGYGYSDVMAGKVVSHMKTSRSQTSAHLSLQIFSALKEIFPCE